MVEPTVAVRDIQDRLIDYFQQVDGEGDRTEAIVQGIWFLFGLRVAQLHPEWARAASHQEDLILGYIQSIGGQDSDDDLEEYGRDARNIVTAVPISLSVGCD